MIHLLLILIAVLLLFAAFLVGIFVGKKNATKISFLEDSVKKDAADIKKNL